MDLSLSPSTDPLEIYRYRDGLYAVDLLTAAIVEFDLFTWLADHPVDLAGLCGHFQFHERPADVLVTLCAANGWIERQNGTLQVTAVAREHLTAGSPWNLAPYYASLANRPVAKDFARVLRTGKPASWGSVSSGVDWHKSMEDETFARQFTSAMDCRGRYLAQALAKAVDLGGRTRLLDIGGGSGIYACTFAAHLPDLRATVFDQAPVDRIARTLIAERGFSDRVAVHAGDFLRESWPAGHDVHLFSNVLHDWDETEVKALLAASAASIQPGGIIVIHDAFINAEKTGPLPVAEYSTLLMHSTQGKCYSVSEYAALLRDVGVVPGDFAATAADRGVLIGHRA
jgi:predicted O-methyltransferase YrrM